MVAMTLPFSVRPAKGVFFPLEANLSVSTVHSLCRSKMQISAGAPADICIFDLHKEWTVDTDKFASKGKNTPLAGRTLKGKVDRKSTRLNSSHGSISYA